MESGESSIYDGLVDVFPESYSSGSLITNDCGKLLVLSDLLTAIRQLSPSDRYMCVFIYIQYTRILEYNTVSVLYDSGHSTAYLCPPQGGHRVQLHQDTELAPGLVHTRGLHLLSPGRTNTNQPTAATG